MQKGTHPSDIHRTLPQSTDAEKGVLCSVLLSPEQTLDRCIERINDKHFHHPAHRIIYQAMVELYKLSRPVEIIVLLQYLEDRQLLDRVGGEAVLYEILTFVPTAANASYYLDIVQEKFLLRQVIFICTEMASRCYTEQGEVWTLLDELESRVLSIGEARYRNTFPQMKELVMAAVENIDRLYKNRGGITGLSTGFKKLDQITNGLHGGEMFVIAARPSMGKTALAMNIAEHVALEIGKAVGIFSLEMSSQQLVQRILCSSARLDLQKLRDGFISSNALHILFAAADRLAKCKIFIDDTTALSILEMRSKARRMKDTEGVELIVIDYLQLLRSSSRRGQENRQIEISEISYGIKALARELNIPVIVLAQLNRQPETREGGKPRLSDLRESGAIEQDADVVALLVRPEVYEKGDRENGENLRGRAELIIAKQRNGPIGEVELTFLKQFTRFETAELGREEGS
ncbi:Replicative DNA helicase [Candidatus Xiphinematobacter sp. Idaho Grape]|uniref:replicative DNA helicase n=1 Tax=Candidatus Xiphinematobacter sp. Idaho Grape TaxID=1704307 RepID=UPI000706EF7E|nr:replicative DNA helicase [Candidatus Xiphinematobacter sp. Idaho Grape]ALJ56956.1 Replicative DNA helicase [Candidatus Xiphinematobacter sp. Idaho Grape]